MGESQFPSGAMKPIRKPRTDAADLEVARWKIDESYALLEAYFDVLGDEKSTAQQVHDLSVYTCAAVYRTLTRTTDEVEDSLLEGDPNARAEREIRKFMGFA